MNTAPSLERIASAYGISTVTIRAWMKRGISTHDLLDPHTLAPKLRASAVNDSPRLRKLEDQATCGMITFRLTFIK